MRQIKDPPLTDYSVPEFKRILMGKLKGLIASKTIADIEYIEKADDKDTPCFIVRVTFGEQGHLELLITSQRKVGLYQTFNAAPEKGRWAGSLFTKYVEERIATMTKPVQGSGGSDVAMLLDQGREALDTRGRSRW